MERDVLLEALLGMPVLTGAEVSRDGHWVAWNWIGVGPVVDVYVAPTDGSSAPVQLTGGDEDTLVVSWAPDARSVVVRQDHGGDERFRLFRVPIDRPGQMEPLTEPDPLYFLRGGYLLPGGSSLIYGMNYDVATQTEIEQTWVYRHDLETGERVVLARPERPGYIDPRPNDQGTHVLYTRQDLDPAGSQVWLVGVDGTDDDEILNAGPAVKIEASWFPDGRHILFLREAGSYRVLGIYDHASGATRRLIDDPGRNIEGAFVPRGGDGRTIVVLEVDEARTHASLLEVETGSETPVLSERGTVIPLHPLRDGRWVVEQYSSTVPGELLATRIEAPGGDASVSISRLWERTSLTPGDMVPAESLHWQSVDGLAIQGWLYRARGEARGTVLKIHGGPTAHSEDAYDPQTQFLAQRGFNVLLPNYRGSTGFGLKFQEAIKADGWGGREQDDIRTGIEALVERGIAAPGRVGITGTSYGGYSSWCGITRWDLETLAASAPICGMTDLIVDYQTTRPDLRPYSEEMLGGAPDDMPERYQERSPINFVDRIRGRLLIVQGLRDPNVTPHNVQAVREALEERGIPYDILIFDDEGHGIYLRKNRAVLYVRLEEFFAAGFGESSPA